MWIWKYLSFCPSCCSMLCEFSVIVYGITDTPKHIKMDISYNGNWHYTRVSEQSTEIKVKIKMKDNFVAIASFHEIKTSFNQNGFIFIRVDFHTHFFSRKKTKIFDSLKLSNGCTEEKCVTQIQKALHTRDPLLNRKEILGSFRLRCLFLFYVFVRSRKANVFVVRVKWWNCF